MATRLKFANGFVEDRPTDFTEDEVIVKVHVGPKSARFIGDDGIVGYWDKWGNLHTHPSGGQNYEDRRFKRVEPGVYVEVPF